MKDIIIKSSPTADTRSCDVQKVTKQQLQTSTKMHIEDVQAGITWIVSRLIEAARKHDHTKLQNLDLFYNDFKNNFNTTNWWRLHQKQERHHVTAPNGLKDDVDLIDIIQYLVDGVMAGMARSGSYRSDDKLTGDLLLKAFNNTTKKLLNSIEISDYNNDTNKK